MPKILKLQCDEINQSLFYIANLVNIQDIITINDESYKDECADCPQATINQLLEISVSQSNVKKIWAVTVRNSQIAKYHIILLKNNAYIQ